MSEMLNIGNSIKLSFIKSLTKPKAIRSYKLQLIPAISIAAQKAEIVENFSVFFIIITISAITLILIKMSEMLNTGKSINLSLKKSVLEYRKRKLREVKQWPFQISL
jgi:hypothetical protein